MSDFETPQEVVEREEPVTTVDLRAGGCTAGGSYSILMYRIESTDYLLIRRRADILEQRNSIRPPMENLDFVGEPSRLLTEKEMDKAYITNPDYTMCSVAHCSAATSVAATKAAHTPHPCHPRAYCRSGAKAESRAHVTESIRSGPEAEVGSAAEHGQRELMGPSAGAPASQPNPEEGPAAASACFSSFKAEEWASPRPFHFVICLGAQCLALRTQIGSPRAWEA
ncbi:hypothetical protein AXG93_1921s1170 [Marchantia polymorpha subsp. ruderalis]|uniref:Uncharacterized protein n=1 Tax=Marchantia polymorpha subsp. ruderalis TaxID=1480154 RepID=A0A176WL30_MARPO|nr:hypothetical protein AXG93_1921s1170 [Marchantia polymorpha subsp. ruderalis]